MKINSVFKVLTSLLCPEQEIFREKPEVFEAYEANVPHTVTPQEFWTRYFKHIIALRVKAISLDPCCLISGSASLCQMQ